MKNAEEYLIAQNYIEIVTLSDKTTKNPSFQRATVVRLLDEYKNYALTEHDAEIKALIEPIEGRVAKLLDDSSFTFGVEPRITLIKIDRALTELKEKL